MKKKVFSKLLMVALVATVGAFTSCKDYDDDINDLRSKVDGLNTSLTTLINDKVTTVSNQVNILEKQLKEVETAYAQADAALQKELDAAKETGKTNAENIKTLISQVAELQTAKGQLEEAIKALQDGLATANANIKANGDNIITLLAKDLELEKGIAEAKEAAKNAADEAGKALAKANEVATDLASLKTKEESDFNNLQNQITKNLTDVNAKIEGVNTALDKRIKVNEEAIATLTTSKANKADLEALQTKVNELDKQYTATLKDIESLQNFDKAQDEINKAQAEENKKLADDIRANAAAIKTINETTLPQLKEDLINHTIPEVVAKQIDAVLEDRLQAFLESDVTDLVEEYYEDGVTLIEALDAKVDSIDEAINTTMTLEFLLVAAAMDSIADAHDTKAGEIIRAYQEADKLVKDSVGKVAAALESAKTTLGNSITTLDEQINGKGEAKGIVGQIATLEEWFAPAAAAEGQEASGLLKYQEELLKSEAVIAKVNDIVAAANDEINSMITSINLFAGPHGDYHYGQDGTGTGWDAYEFDHHLLFTYAIEKDNIFPNDAHRALVDDTIKFTKGYIHTYPDSILVRVSPVNAVLDKDLIALINSQGQDVVGDSIIKVLSVEKYNRPEGQYLTRATNNGETGLWVIKFKLQEEKAEVWEKFKSASIVDVNGRERQILYSVGVKNTKKADKDDNRYVVSEYDLDLGSQKAFHIWNFNVNEKSVAKIHNRYVKNEQKPNVGAVLYTDDTSKDYEDSYNEELTYAPYLPFYTSNTDDDCDRRFGQAVLDENNQYVTDEFGEAVMWDYPGYTYAEMKKQQTADDEAYTFNVTDRHNHNNIHAGGYYTNGIDNRDEFKSLSITFVNGWADIDIEFPTVTCDRPTEIAGFYVLLDQNFAKESTTSEVAAWTQYIYKNVGFQSVNGYQLDANGKRVFKYDTERNDEQAGIVKGVRKAHLFKGTKGTISIKDARSAKGDVIGFRVYAVNLDGTLYDPDGRAFYVKVGDPQEDQVLNFEVTAFKQKGDSAIQKKDITYTKGDDTKVQNLDIVGYNAEAAKEFKNQFFNIQSKEINKGGQYHLQWYWAGNNPEIRTSHNSTSIYEPIEDTDRYLTELFDFKYTINDGTKDKEVDLADAALWNPLAATYPSTTWSTDAWIQARNYKGDINNVKVTLQDAARLQNDSTYHLKLVVKLHDADGVVSVVNTIYVNVTKRMPNRLPEAFKVRIGQEDVVNKVCFYLRPSRESYTWDIDDWFDINSTDGKFGLIDAIGMADEEGNVTAGQWNTGKYGHYVNGGYGDNEPKGRTTRSQGVNPPTPKSLRWAQDVRPYNFEEMFVGLVDENRVFDVDYKFVFPGAGSVVTPDYDGTAETVADFTKDAVSLYSQKMTAPIVYTGLDELKNEATLFPGYYLPLVYYGVMDKWNSTSKMLSVKAGYTYHDINFVMKDGKVVRDAESNIDGEKYGTDYEVTPNYFDKDGNFVAEADAAFKCYFKCAIDKNFTAGFRTELPADEFKQFDPSDNTWKTATITVPTGEKAEEIGTKAANPIPYGIAFTLYVDSIGVTWVSNLAAYTQKEATGASYFMTNFNTEDSWYGYPGFTTAWTSNSSDRSKDLVKDKVDQNGKSFYTDTLTYMNPTLGEYNTWGGFVLRSVIGNKFWADWLGLAGLTDPYIKSVKINKASGSVTLSEANGNLDRINDYFTVTPTSTVNGKFGLQFTPKINSLNPTVIKMFEFELANKAKIVHQWGHSQDINTNAPKIYWGDPNSIDNIQSARRSR